MLLANKIHPEFRLIVEEALKSDLPGGKVNLLKCWAECEVSQDQEGKGHCFAFTLPFAGTDVEWEIWFKDGHFGEAPDFLCCLEDLEFDPLIYTSLTDDWDLKNPYCLTNLFTKLNSMVLKPYQLEQVKKFPKIEDIYNSLKKNKINEHDLDVCFISKMKKCTSCNILIKLGIIEEELPVLDWIWPRQVYGGLLLSLETNGNISLQSLVISPYLERVLGPHLDHLQVPSVPSSSFSPSFVHELTEKFNAALKTVCDSHSHRRQILAALLSLYPKNVAFYDEAQYEEATLHFTINQSRYVAHLKLKDEMKMILFALDRPVKANSNGETIYYNQSEQLVFKEKSSKDNFSKYLHEMLTTRFRKFISTVNQAA